MRPNRSHQRGFKALPLAGAVALAVLAAWGGWWLGTRQAQPHAGLAGDAAAPATGSAPTAAPATAGGAPSTDAAGRKVLYWHDPMVPGQRFDKPGKSPFMDMMLVPVYADEGADSGTLSISPRLAQNFGVRLVEAKAGTLGGGFSAPGTLVVDERTIVAVQARVQGYVEKLLVRATYDSVRAGQPLAELYVPEWLAAQEELLALKGSAQPGAAALVDAARARLGLLGMPAAEIARVEREGRPSARVTITAPQSGVVWEIGARDGMAVMQGTTLFRLAGQGSVWVVAEVPEAQAGALRTGAPVEATIAALPDVFKGTVSTLLPEVNAATRTVRARIVLANPDVSLKPGCSRPCSSPRPHRRRSRCCWYRRGGDPDRQAERRGTLHWAKAGTPRSRSSWGGRAACPPSTRVTCCTCRRRCPACRRPRRRSFCSRPTG